MHENIPKMLGKIIEHRDIILVDQRGIGYSTPRMSCPEISMEGDFSPEPEDIPKAKQCRDKLVALGADLNGYTTRENAADFDALRQALGYKKWNLLGASYGVLLGMEIMKNHPEGLRSAILDSAYPPHINGISDQGVAMLALVGQFVDNCNADKKCISKHPNLQTQINAIANEIDQQGDKFPIAVADFLMLLTEDISNPDLPGMIDDLADGKFPSMENMEQGPSSEEDISGWAMGTSITCAEEFPYEDYSQYNIENSRWSPVFYKAIKKTIASGKIMCGIWDVKPLEGAQDKFVSDVPSLVMASDTDSATPIQWSRETMQYLNNGHIVELKGLGHITFFARSPCPTTIMAKFLDDPSAKFKAADIKSCQKMFLTER